MSTEKTRAPSLANNAASGRPTTSDLRGHVSDAECSLRFGVRCAHLLITVIVLPYARSPYGSSLLYTPMNSRHFTIARGVHGRIDFT